MTTLTPKNQKLYGYLHGYEQCCFTGSKRNDVLSSFKEQFELECRILSNGKSLSLDTTKVVSLVDKFLAKFYQRMKDCRTSRKVADIADKAKKDSKTLSRFLSDILTGSLSEVGSFAVCPLNGNQPSESFIDICMKCPYYIRNKFCFLYGNEDDEVIPDIIAFYLEEYKYLSLAILNITYQLIGKNKLQVFNLSGYHQLFEHIITEGKIFELMNPSEDVRQEYINDALSLLTKAPLDHDSEKFRNYMDVLHEVMQDILDNKKPYIKSFAEAFNRNKALLRSKFDEEVDFYTSMHGTSQKHVTGYRYSLLSSCLEIDVNFDDYREFDDYIGYISRYIKDNTSNQKIFCIKTILINNPGKFKPRIIHIGDNPTQDRCNFIHMRLARFLDDLVEDCTKRQDDGREFLQSRTLDWFLEEDPLRKIGIYCFDFSNATDTLDQVLQYEVLKFMMGSEVADFWDKLAKMPKLMVNADGSLTEYTQSCGQPQGLVGSFDAFALAHHFIFLMDMKVLGMEDCDSKKFYRILGDDSVCCSIGPEYDYFSDDSISYDEDGFKRSLFEKVHFDICRNFAGFEINYDKSESTHWDSREAKLDFAKVTYRNGIFFSPVPFRLSMKFSESVTAKLAVAIWRGNRKDPYSRDLMDAILEDQSDTLKDIIRCGEIPFLEFFKNNDSYNSAWLSRVRYANGVSHINSILAFSIMSDRARDDDNDFTLESLTKLLTTKLVRQIDGLDPNHKVFRIWENNYDIMQTMHNIYDSDEFDDKFLSLACSTLGSKFLRGEVFDSLYQVGQTRRLLLLAKSNPELDVSTVFPDFNMRSYRKLVDFSNSFMTRSITNRPREEVKILEQVLQILDGIEEVLGPVPSKGAFRS